MKPRPNYMPPEQFNQVIESIPILHIRKWKDEDVQMLFKLCYWCALRISEALRLTVENFDFETNDVWLGRTKTEKGATTPIPNIFIPELMAYLVGKSGPLFAGMNYQIVEIWTRRLGKILNIVAWTTPQSETGEKTKTHIFRKSIGKDMLYGVHGTRAPLTFISETLRHKGKNPLGTTIQYLKIGSEELKDWWIEQEEKSYGS